MDKEILYTIGEVANLLNVNSSKIRFWLKKFPDYLTCTHTSGGQRRFRYEDLLRLRTILRLTVEEKLTLDGVQKRLLTEKTKKDKLRFMVSTVISDYESGVSRDTMVEKLSRII